MVPMEQDNLLSKQLINSQWGLENLFLLALGHEIPQNKWRTGESEKVRKAIKIDVGFAYVRRTIQA